jgi:ATP-binding cassette subfamily F protein 3
MRYGSKVLFDDVTTTFSAGRRYGLTGPNGAGKSTFMKLLTGELQAQKGAVTRPSKLGVLRQDQFAFDEFRVVDTVIMGNARLWAALEERERLYEKHDMTDADGMRLGELEGIVGEEDGYSAESDAAILLAGLDIPDELHERKMKELQGGQKVRVLLAQALFGQPQALLLDEPTNHLDLEMRLALTMALQEFSGAVVVVSHDRHLLKSTTDEFLLVADGQVQPFDGDLDDYARWLIDYRARQAPASSSESNPDKSDKRVQRQAAAALRQQLAPHKREAEKLEKELGQIQEKLAAVEARLGESDIYDAARKDELRDALAEQAKLKSREADLEERWLLALETLEALQAELEAAS